jgi:hypothetical protein
MLHKDRDRLVGSETGDAQKSIGQHEALAEPPRPWDSVWPEQDDDAASVRSDERILVIDASGGLDALLHFGR